MANDEPKPTGLDLWTNQSERARGVLDYVLWEDDPETKAVRDSMLEFEEARRAEKILDTDTGRSKSRVLFITSDTAVLEHNTAKQRAYLELNDQFDEIHVVVVTTGTKAGTVTRAGANVWMYTSPGVGVWFKAWNARAMALQHLRFNDSVRPDIIVAKDPTVSTLAAYLVSRVLCRPYQVHVTGSEFSINTIASTLERIAVRYVLRRAHGIATVSEAARESIRSLVSKKVPLYTLPTFRNVTQFATSTPQFDLHERYPQYTFFILTTGPLQADSHLHDVFAALRTVLTNPKIALIVLGTGLAKQLFEEKVKILGIAENVIFLPPETTDLVSCYRSADLMIETGLEEESEERVLRAVMANTPMALYETTFRTNLFEDGDSAYICEPGDTVGLKQKTNLFLNQSAIRRQFARRLRDIAATRLHENPVTYHRALRNTIEETLLEQFTEMAVAEPDANVPDRAEKIDPAEVPASPELVPATR